MKTKTKKERNKEQQSPTLAHNRYNTLSNNEENNKEELQNYTVKRSTILSRLRRKK